jgi:hypothetical protein
VQASVSRKEAEALRQRLADRDAYMATLAAELAGILSRGDATSPKQRKELEALLRKLSAYGNPLQPMDPSVEKEVRPLTLEIRSGIRGE